MSDAANKADAPDVPEAQLLRLRRSSRLLRIMVDGIETRCFEGETVATAILAQRAFISSDARRTHGLWCGIGVCFECVVAVGGAPGVRACMTRVRPGMAVGTQIARQLTNGIEHEPRGPEGQG